MPDEPTTSAVAFSGDDPVALKATLQSLAAGVALVDPATGAVLFENANFFQWFPATDTASESIADRIPDLDLERAESRLANGRKYSFDTEIEVGGRDTPVRITMHRIDLADGAVTCVECADVSKEKEVQYMLDSYSNMAERNARELQREKDRVEKLLLNIMPRAVFEELKDYGTTTPQNFDAASILMLDFVGFTEMTVSQDAAATISELNDIFSAFDRIVEMFGCERLRTVGDAYMAVSGVPEATPDHAANIARTALRLRRYLERRNAAHTQEWRARIGINTGTVIGSLVGIQKYVYDLFGPGVNLAARMEGLSEPMHITLNEETMSLLKDEFTFTERGDFDVKGFGNQRLYFLEGEVEDRRFF